MRKLVVCVAWILISLMFFTVAGCRNNDVPAQDPQDEDPPPGGNEPGPGGNSGLNTDLNAPVTFVPAEFVDSIDRAVIRQGSLWLGSADGRMWRQTQNREVTCLVWAPDGHALAYITTDYSDYPVESLYLITPGHSPEIVNDDVLAHTAWLIRSGFLWSPDSSALAYGIGETGQLAITRVADMSEKIYTLNKVVTQTPYWLTNDILAYTSCPGDRPSVVLTDAQGNVINELIDTTSPIPIDGGALVATGSYDPDGMASFYTNGLSFIALDGTMGETVFDQPIHQCLIALDPGIQQHKYLAISDGENLFLQKYSGLTDSANPQRIDLLTQNLFLTYSEFYYPLWFSRAPDGNKLAALKYTFTQEGEYGEQEGYWDLVLVSKNAQPVSLKENLYTVSAYLEPIPFQGILPLNWTPCGQHVNFLMNGSEDSHDLWTVDISTKVSKLVLENCSLPEYRPIVP